MPYRRAVAATWRGACKLSRTILSFSSSDQRRRRPVSTTSSRSTWALRLSLSIRTVLNTAPHSARRPSADGYIEERFWRKKEAVEGGGPQNNSSTANIAVDISTAAWKVRSSMDAVAANTAKRCVADRPLQFCARCVCAIHFSKRQTEMRGPRAWRNIGPLYGGGYIRPRSVTRAALLVFALTTFWPGCGIWQTAFEEQPPYC